MAQSHDPHCRKAGRENDPVPSSLQPQGHPSPSWGSMNPRVGPGNGLARPAPHPAVMEAVLSCAGSAPSGTACRGSGVTMGQAVQDLVSPHPQSAEQDGLNPVRLQQDGRHVQARQEEGPRLGKPRSEPPLENCGSAVQLGMVRRGCWKAVWEAVLPTQPQYPPLPPAQCPQASPLCPRDRSAPT